MRRGYRQPGSWRTLVRKVLERDAGVCRHCGGEATTADHLVGVADWVAAHGSDEGAHDLDNLVASCRPCNDLRAEAQRVAGLRRTARLRSRRRRGEIHPNRVR